MPAKSRERISRQPQVQIKKGLWSPEEDQKLISFLKAYGTHYVSWSKVPHRTGLARCGKSCRLRWINYLRPDLKRGTFSASEEKIIIGLHALMGNKWSKIAKHLKGRTDNEIKNFWNSNLKKKLRKQGIDPDTHAPLPGFESKSKVPSQNGFDPKSLQSKPETSGWPASCHQNFDCGSLIPDASPFPSFLGETSSGGWPEHSQGNYRYLLQQEELLRHVQLMHQVWNSSSEEEIYRMEGGVITSARPEKFATSHHNDLNSSQAAVQRGVFSYAHGSGPLFDSQDRAFSALSMGYCQVPFTAPDHSSFWDSLAKSRSNGISQNTFGFDLSSTRAGGQGGIGSCGYNHNWSDGVAHPQSNRVGLKYLLASTGTNPTTLETAPDHFQLEKEMSFEDEEVFSNGSYYSCVGTDAVDSLEDAYVASLPGFVADDEDLMQFSTRIMPDYLSNPESPQAFKILGFDVGCGLPTIPETDAPTEIEDNFEVIELLPPQPLATHIDNDFRTLNIYCMN